MVTLFLSITQSQHISISPNVAGKSEAHDDGNKAECSWWHSPERQSARMSKITNDGLTWSGTGCFIAVRTHLATVGVKWLMPTA